MHPPRDEDEALELVHRMESYYKEAFAGFDEDESFYEGRLDEFVQPPPGFDMTIPTTARAVVDEAVDNVTPEDFLITYSPRGETEKDMTDADSVRRWVGAWWKYLRTKGNDLDIVRDFTKNLFMSGQACFKVCVDRSLWPELSEDVENELMESGGESAVLERAEAIEEIRRSNTPVLVKSIPPSCIMIDPTVSSRKLWIIERYQSLPEDVAGIYGLDIEDLRMDYWKKGYTIHEIWTASHIDARGNERRGKHWVFCNWDMVLEEEHDGDIPYVVKYSGFGRESFQGKPELKAVGFFTRQTKSMLLAEMRRHMQFDAIMTQVAFPIAFLDEEAHDSILDFSPGSVNYLPQTSLVNIDKMWVKPPIPDAEYLNSLNAISAQIERGTVQRALRGAGVPGTDSAAQLGMIGSQAKLRITSVKSATEGAMSEISALALRMIDRKLREKVSIFGFESTTKENTLGPENIKGHYRVGVTFKPNEDAIKERKLVLANQAVSQGGLSYYDAYVFAGFDNPMELIARRRADEVMQEPAVRRAMAKRSLSKWGYDIDQIEMEERTEQMQQQLALSELAQTLRLGTPRGEQVAPPPSGPTDPGLLPPEGEGMVPVEGPGGPPPGAVPGGDISSGLPMPAGNPAGVQQAPVADMMSDISALGAAR